jgi:Flp pilus assembly protein TadG
MVEAAFVLPILVLIIMGIIDLGMWNFQKSEATSAARDGARSALIGAVGADCGVAGYDSSVNAYPCAGSYPANTRIHDAIAARLGGRSFTFKVECTSSTTTTVKVCTVDPATVDRDRIRVTVTWQRPSMTFVTKGFGTQTITAASRMTITA